MYRRRPRWRDADRDSVGATDGKGPGHSRAAQPGTRTSGSGGPSFAMAALAAGARRRQRRLAHRRQARLRRQYIVRRCHGGTRPRPWRHRARPAERRGDPFGQARRIYCRRRYRRISRRHRRGRNRGQDYPRPRDRRSPGSPPGSDRGGDSRLLPWRRSRNRAGLQIPDRDRRRAARLSGGPAWTAPRSRRHGAPHASDQSDAGDARHADRTEFPGQAGEIARARRRGDAGAPRARRRQIRGHGRIEDRAGKAVGIPAQFRACPHAAFGAHEIGDREEGAGRALSGAPCADRFMGSKRRRSARDAEG